MGFIVKLKKGILRPAPTTTTSNEITLSENALTFIAFGGVDNNLFGIGERSLGRINRGSGVINAGQVQFQLNNTDVFVIDNNDNTYNITIDFSVTATNGRNEIRSVVNPTLLIDLRLALDNLTRMLSSFTPVGASKRVGIISKNSIGVTYDDVDIPANSTHEFIAQGSLEVSIINGVTPILVRQSFDDVQLSTVSSRIQRFGISNSQLAINQRFIFGNKTNFITNQVIFEAGDSSRTLEYTNTLFDSVGEVYSGGITLEYDDSLTPLYYFDQGSDTLVKASALSVTTTAPPTTAPPTTAPPSEPVIFFSQIPSDNGIANIEITFTEFTVFMVNDVSSGMEYRIRLETSSLVNATSIGIQNFVDSQNVTIKTTYTDGDLLTRDNISNSTVLYTYDLIIDEIDNSLTATGTVELVIETNINGTFQETDRISYTATKFGIREIITRCPDNNSVSVSIVEGFSSVEGVTINYGVLVTVSNLINLDQYEVTAGILPTVGGGGLSLISIDQIGDTNNFQIEVSTGNVDSEVQVRFTPRFNAPDECETYTAIVGGLQSNIGGSF